MRQMKATDLNATQASVVSHFLEHGLAISGSATMMAMESGPDRAVIGVAPLDVGDDAMSCMFTTLSASDTVFFTVTDGSPSQIAPVLADLETYSSDRDLGVGDVIRSDRPEMKAAGRRAMVLSLMRGNPFVASLPPEVSVRDKKYAAYYAVFLDQVEYEVIATNGIKALMAYWETHPKDFVTFAAPA